MDNMNQEFKNALRDAQRQRDEAYNSWKQTWPEHWLSRIDVNDHELFSDETKLLIQNSLRLGFEGCWELHVKGAK